MQLDALGALGRRSGMPDLLAALGEGQARFVGGAVRDTLLGLCPTDLDLATPLSPYEVMRRLGGAGIKVVPTGITHGTVTAIGQAQKAEITTLRSDVSTDGRRATVAYTDDWREDAARRDFTINALYADPVTGELFDYFDGWADLQARRVRFIGDPRTRIAEDHLRILRFFRFHARFGTEEPDPASLEACLARANDLMALSRERVADELLKLLGLPAPVATVRIMVERQVLAAVLPEIVPEAVARLHDLIEAEQAAGIAPASLRRLSSLLPPDPSAAEKVAARLKLANRERKRLACAADLDIGADPQALAYYIGQEGAEDRLLLAGRPDDAALLTTWVPPRLPITGGTLIARGLEPGPRIAQCLKIIERQWVDEGFPSGDGERFVQIVEAALAKLSEQGCDPA